MIKMSLCILIAIFISVPSFAQDIPDKKEYDTYTSGGVDLMTGQFKLYSHDLSVGSGDFPSKLDLIREVGQYPRQADEGYVTHNFRLTAYCFPCDSGASTNSLTVKAFDGVHTFDGPYVPWGTARTWTNTAYDGAQVIDNGSTLEFRSKAGDQIFFAAISTGVGCGSYCRVPVYAVMANGESIVFSYQNTSSAGYPLSRLTSVVNSRGYGFQFSYVNPSLTSGNAAQRSQVASVAAFRSGCVASAVVSCTTGTLASVSYGWTLVGTNSYGTNLYRMTSFTNPQGRVLNYEYNGHGHRMSAAAYADAPSVKLFQNTYTNTNAPAFDEGMVTQQKDALLRTTYYNTDYRYDRPRSRPTVTVTAPDQTVTTYKFSALFNGAVLGKPTSIDKPLSRTLIYTYNNGRLSSSTDAEGIRVSYTLDDRGNITTTTTTPKTGSTLGALVESASFPTCNTSNFRICNKPSYTIDARGARTDYQYNTTHGQATVVLLPANANNVRAVIRNTYSTFHPGPGVMAPSGTTLASSYLLTRVDECLTSTVTGTTVDFTYTCSSGSRKRTNFLYTASTSSSRTNHELEGILDDADGAAVRSCYRYDKVGNKIAEIKPRAALSTCS